MSEGDSVVVGQEIMSYVPCLLEDTMTQEDIKSVTKVEEETQAECFGHCTNYG